MKSLMNTAYLGILLTAAGPATVLADGTFKGELALIPGFSYGKSNFNTDNPNKQSPLNSEGESESEATVLPLVNLSYHFGQDETYSVFAGFSRDDIVVGDVGFKIGAGMKLADDSSLQLSVLPTVIDDETWSDPYLVNQNREETEISGNAFLAEYKNAFGLGPDLSLGYYDKDVDEEQSGQGLLSSADSQLLDRNGDGIYFSAAFKLPAGEKAFIKPAIYVNDFSADGAAMSFTRYSLGLSYGMLFEQSSLVLSGRVSRTEFDAENPVFSETQSDDGYKINLSYEYREPFGWQNWSLVSLMGYSTTDSNINFYDEEGAFAGVGFSYKF